MTIYDPFYGHYLPESPEPPKKSKKETFDEQLRRTLPNWLAGPRCPNPLSDAEIENIICEKPLDDIDFSLQFIYNHPCEGTTYPYERYND